MPLIRERAVLPGDDLAVAKDFYAASGVRLGSVPRPGLR